MFSLHCSPCIVLPALWQSSNSVSHHFQTALVDLIDSLSFLQAPCTCFPREYYPLPGMECRWVQPLPSLSLSCLLSVFILTQQISFSLFTVCRRTNFERPLYFEPYSGAHLFASGYQNFLEFIRFHHCYSECIGLNEYLGHSGNRLLQL